MRRVKSKQRSHYKILMLCIALMVTHCKSRNSAFFSADLTDEPPMSSAAKLIPGSYVGFAKVPSEDSKLPMIWEVIEDSSVAGSGHYRIIVKTFWGGFYSKDYQTDYFPSVTFNAKNKALSFLSKATTLTPQGVKLRSDSLLTGVLQSNSNAQDKLEFKAVYSGQRKSFDVQKQLALMFPQQKVIAPFRGNFQGQCGDKETLLQLETSRWYSPNPLGNEHMRFVRLMGRLALKDQMLCGDEDVTCTRFNFQAGNYNLFTGQLELFERQQKKICQYHVDKVQCEECSLKRKSSEIALENATFEPLPLRDQRLDIADDPKATFSAETLKGEYYGYVFHRQTQAYQLLRLKVFPEKANKLGAVATLFFGGPSSKEFIVYRFDPVPLVKNRAKVILDGRGEAFMQVSSWNSKHIRGMWYAKTFGIVGSAELQKTTVPTLEPSTRLISTLTGSYTSEKSKLSILATSEISDSEGIFFPLRVKGICNDLAGQDRRRTISEVSYDFYTGQVAIELDDGRIAYGDANEKGFELYWPDAAKMGAVIAAARQKEFFEYKQEEFSGTTARKMFELFKDGVTSPKYFY